MAKQKTVLTVDIGSDTLKLAEFIFTQEGDIVLQGFDFRKLSDAEGNILESFTSLYPTMLRENNFRAKNVRLSVSGQSSFVRLSKLPPVSGAAGISKVVDFEARQSIPYSMNEVVWGHQEIKRVIKHEEVIEGTTIESTSEELETLIVAVKEDQIEAYSDVILSCGQTVLSIEVAPVALFNVGKAVSDENSCVLLLNIGGRSSSLAISDHGRIFVRTIPIGGDMITQQIAKDFSVSPAEAEELKKRNSAVALGGAYEELDSEVAATVAKIARNVMTRLHGEVLRSLNSWRSQHGGNAPSRLLLAGGGSMMQYMVDFFDEKLHIPVDYLNAFSLISLSNSIDKEKLLDVAPMFPELIGMALHDVTRTPVEITLLPAFLRNQEEFRRKAPYFYGGLGALIVCLLLLLLGVNETRKYNERLVEKVESAVAEVKSIDNDVRRKFNEVQSVKSDYSEMRKKLTQREAYFRMLEELQSLMPNTMYFVAVEGAGEFSQPQPVAQPRSNTGGMGGLFGGGNRPAAQQPKANPNAFVPINAESLTEIRELRLKGYSLVLEQPLLEEAFRDSLKNSKFFIANSFMIEDNSFQPVRGRNNITSFVIRIKLKEPLKK